MVPFTKITMFLILNKFRTLKTTVQMLEEMIWMLNELIQANEMVFMNFWYIEHNDASFGDELIQANEIFFMNFWYIEH